MLKVTRVVLLSLSLRLRLRWMPRLMRGHIINLLVAQLINLTFNKMLFSILRVIPTIIINRVFLVNLRSWSYYCLLIILGSHFIYNVSSRLSFCVLLARILIMVFRHLLFLFCDNWGVLQIHDTVTLTFADSIEKVRLASLTALTWWFYAFVGLLLHLSNFS